MLDGNRKPLTEQTVMPEPRNAPHDGAGQRRDRALGAGLGLGGLVAAACRLAQPPGSTGRAGLAPCAASDRAERRPEGGRATGLRSERRLSHVFTLDVPGLPRLLHITYAAITNTHDLPALADIVQNARDLVRALGVQTPRAALLSAVETVSDRLPSTLLAAAICKMHDRGKIAVGLVDGPLAFDNAISAAAAAAKSIASPVAGQAGILVAPNLEGGNMIAKQLIHLGEAEAASVALGAHRQG